MTQHDQLLTIAEAVLARAKAHGAGSADAIVVEGTSLAANVRLGKIESIERSDARDLGLRVFIGASQAIVSTTDFTPGNLDAVAERAVAMARAAPPDEFAGLAEPADLAGAWPDCDLADDASPDADRLVELARRTEDAALAVEGITNSSGGSAGAGASGLVLASSQGFRGAYRRTGYSLSCSVVAGEGVAMERDWESASAVHFQDLEAPDAVGRRAGERTVRRLKPRKVASQAVPVVYESRIASGLLGHLASAISGASIARGTSFLKDALGSAVFSPGISVIDDPHRRRGLRSRPFDGEGVATRGLALIENGMLKSWILDVRSARQLGLRTTGHAARSVGSPPSPSTTNLHLAPGAHSRESLLADIRSGLFITDLMGMGVNLVTGDYSRGAAGFWIENGEIAYPVSEITVAGNLRDMFRRLTPASDLEFRYATNAPTVRVEGMTVAGT